MDGFVYLARISVTENGKPVSVRAMDIVRVTTVPGGTADAGSVLQMSVGQSITVSESVATVHGAIDTLWDESNA